MTALIFDFADIHSRMKGELAKPAVVPAPGSVLWRMKCHMCRCCFETFAADLCPNCGSDIIVARS